MFRRRSQSGQPAWFEDGSSVRCEIEQFTSVRFETEVFRWSGRNSFRRREQAALEFRTHLQRERARRPEARHIVLAHSHGGTVAAQALTAAYFSDTDPPPVDGLICLATPFAFPILATRYQRKLIAYSAGSFLAALLLAALLSFIDLTVVPGFLLLASSVVLTSKIAEAINRLPRPLELIVRWSMPVRDDIPVYTLRSSRDEASLALGLAQTLHAVVSRLSTEAQQLSPSTSRLFSRTTMLAVIPFVSIGAGLTLALPGSSSLTLAQRGMIGFAFGNGVAGLAYLVAFACLAGTAGFLPLKIWAMTMPEIDSSPPNTQCTARSYSDLDPDACRTRHGIYEDEKVVADIAHLIEGFAGGHVPRFMTGAEMSCRLSERKRSRR
jgi:hypothetical protein